jgi:hypothetical protein
LTTSNGNMSVHSVTPPIPPAKIVYMAPASGPAVCPSRASGALTELVFVLAGRGHSISTRFVRTKKAKISGNLAR